LGSVGEHQLPVAARSVVVLLRRDGAS
jgi:hypothetical protein